MPATAAAAIAGHFHTSRMARNKRKVVSSMVVDTAVPYAPASRSELPNAMVVAMVAAISSQLTTGI